MTDSDKNRIQPLYEKSNLSLCRIRVRAAIGAIALNNALRPKLEDTTDDKFTDLQDQASNIIVSALSDQALSRVRSVIGSPGEIICKM